MTESATVKSWAAEVAHKLAAEEPDIQNAALEKIALRDGEAAKGAVITALADERARRAAKAAADKVAREQKLAKLAPPPPEPAPEPPPEPATPQPKAAPADTAPVLNPGAPYDNASEFIHRTALVDGHCTLWFWQDQFYRWSGRVYEPVPHEVMRQQVYRFLDGARKRSGEQLLRFQPTPRHVNETIDALKSHLALGLECHPPMWLDRRESAKDWVVFQNGVVNMLTEEVRPLTPDLWAHNALGFDWDPDAECETWATFLFDVFRGDQQSVDFVEQWMGYNMTDETCFQKGAMFIGEKRSGKGTIAHVMQHLVGDASYVGLSFANWTRGENSQQSLIGKRVGVFPDVRLPKGRAFGKSYDPGGITHASAELLLNIIGEDSITIGRKYLGPWQGQLRIKLTLISNEVPNLNDPGGVLPSRFIKLHFPVTFFGREDPDLRAKLRAELPGIAVRCVRAYGDLRRNGKFIQPAASRVLELDLLAASDPFTAFVLETFEVDHSGMVVKSKAYQLFQSWCARNDRQDVLRSVSDKKFGERLKGVDGFGHVASWRQTGSSPRVWLGLRVKPKAKED